MNRLDQPSGSDDANSQLATAASAQKLETLMIDDSLRHSTPQPDGSHAHSSSDLASLSVTAPAPSTPGSLTFVRWPRRSISEWLRIAALLLLPLGAAMFTAFVIQLDIRRAHDGRLPPGIFTLPIWMALGFILLAGLLLSGLFSLHRTEKLLKSTSEEAASAGPVESIQILAERLQRSASPRSILSFLKGMFKENYAGTTILLANRPLGSAIVPFGVGFEPLPLSYNNTAVKLLDDASEEVRTRKPDGHRRSLISRGAFAYTLTTHITGGLIWAYVVIAFAMTRSVPALYSVAIAAFCIAVPISYWVTFTRSGVPGSNERFIAPQRLIARRNLLKTRFDLQVFDRNHSMVVAMRARLGFFDVIIINRAQSHMMRLMAADFELFLRAWLSPVTPPPADRMSDLE